MGVDPAFLLFKKTYGSDDVTLFANGLDLATHLLNNPKSEYRLSEEERRDPIELSRATRRLQSYISLLINGRGVRKLTRKFTNSLHAIITEKLFYHNVNYEEVYSDIITSIEIANSSESQRGQDGFLFEFLKEKKNANYIAIFTSRPLELEANPTDAIASIRSATLDALADYFMENGRIVKYSYNFPNEAICTLFWRELFQLLVDRVNERELTSQLSQFLSRNGKVIKGNDKIQKIRYMVNSLLELSNAKSWIQVFHLKEPVFVIPHAVINPNEISNSKGYIFLGHEQPDINIFRYSPYDLQIWRTFVWDILKANRKGISVKYQGFVEEDSDEMFS
jgi:hypothetical protein